MAFASVRSSTLLGVQGRAGDVEIHVGMGLPGFTIVGQPDEACRESRDRVRAALLSCDLPWPNRRITVNLATSVHERKGGAGLDVAIAIGLLIVQDILPLEVAGRYAFIAELGLDGTLRPVAGVVPLVAAIDDRIVVVANECEREARIAARNEVVCAQTLAHLVQCLVGESAWTPAPIRTIVNAAPPIIDMKDVRGQTAARHALEIAAAGAHHLLFVELQQSPRRRCGAEHAGRCGDVPAGVVVVGHDRRADAAFGFNAQQKRMQKITPADGLMLSQSKNGRLHTFFAQMFCCLTTSLTCNLLATTSCCKLQHSSILSARADLSTFLTPANPDWACCLPPAL